VASEVLGELECLNRSGTAIEGRGDGRKTWIRASSNSTPEG